VLQLTARRQRAESCRVDILEAIVAFDDPDGVVSRRSARRSVAADPLGHQISIASIVVCFDTESEMLFVRQAAELGSTRHEAVLLGVRRRRVLIRAPIALRLLA
jgi:hypothetical protein